MRVYQDHQIEHTILNLGSSESNERAGQRQNHEDHCGTQQTSCTCCRFGRKTEGICGDQLFEADCFT